MEFGLGNISKQQTKSGSDSNVGHGLGEFLQQNGPMHSMNQQQGGERNAAAPSVMKTPVNTSGASIGKNTVSKANGILNEEGLHRVSGWEKRFKGTALKAAVKKLNSFHAVMDKEVSIQDMEPLGEAKAIFLQLIESINVFLQEGSRLHKKEQAALRPVMSSLLIQLYSMGNVFHNGDKLEFNGDERVSYNGENLVYDYLMQNQLKSVRLGDVMTGHGVRSVQGNMASTDMDSGQIDRTALQIEKIEGTKKWHKNENDVPKTVDWLQEIRSRRLPSLDDKNAVEKLEQIAKMLEDIELQAETTIQREDVRTEFFDVTKMLHLLLSNPGLMTGEGVEALKNGEISSEKTDLLNTAEFFQAVAGMTVQEATLKLDEIRQSKAETADKDSISTGGARSQVFIDLKKKRVLRTSQEQGGTKVQKSRNNFNYDEAMSRLGEITGLGGQAGARTTYYKDLEGNLQYGTNMDLAGGKRADQAKLSFGDEAVDSQMKKGRYNIFGHGSKEELNRNADLIISSFNMQIIDYLAVHQDRHTENFFVDLNAENPKQAFMGIDNDNVFGLGTDALRDSRTVSYGEHAKGSYEKGPKSHGYYDVVSILKGFQCIPTETATQVVGLDEEKIEAEMRPYLDRAARFALISRIRKLKKYVFEEANIVDIRTHEGMEEFKKETLGGIVRTIMDTQDYELFGADAAGSHARYAPGILMRALAGSYFGLGAMAETEDGKFKYASDYEYMEEGQTEEQFHHSDNYKNRGKKLWNSFEGMVRAAGMEQDARYLEIKKAIAEGKMGYFYTGNMDMAYQKWLKNKKSHS